MDWKQFIASVVGSLAWPAAAVAILLLFREQVGRLILQIKKLGAAGVNVEMAEAIEDLRVQAKIVESEADAPLPDVIVLDPPFLNLAKKFPEAAVLQEYKELESVLLQIRARLPDNKPHRNLNEVLKYLNDHGHISGSVIGLFHTLRGARNSVAHATEKSMTPEEAVELGRETRMLVELFRNVLDKLPPKNNRI